MTKTSSPDPASQPEPGSITRTTIIKRGLIVLGVALLVIAVLCWPSREQPRVAREIDAFQARYQSGLEYLHRDWKTKRVNTKGGTSLSFLEIDTESDSPGYVQREWQWSMPSEMLPTSDLSAFSKTVLAGWKVPDAYPLHSSGDDGSRILQTFRDSQSHVCLLTTAFTKNGRNTIHTQAIGVYPTPNEEPHASPDEEPPAANMASLDQFRKLFTAELETRCAPYQTASRNPRERGGSYRFDRPGSGYTGPTIRESEWRWSVPQDVLDPDALRTFSNKIQTQWNPESTPIPGFDYSFTLSFGNAERRALVSIIAIPGRSSARGMHAETTIHYYQLFLDLEATKGSLAPELVEESAPIDFEALRVIPGSTEKERLANAALGSDGRMLKRLREQDKTSYGTWKIEYTLRPSTPISEETLKTFATSHDMTWNAKSYQDPQRHLTNHSLRFFKIMEFSEDQINTTTAAIKRFCHEHEIQYIGWGYKSDKIRRRDDP